MEPMVQISISEKIDFYGNLMRPVKYIEENTNESVRTFLENLVDMHMQDKIPVMWSYAKENKLARLMAPAVPRKRELQSQKNKIISRNDTVVRFQSFMKRFSTGPVLKCTVNIYFPVLITGPEKLVVKGSPLRTYLARQAFQELHSQLSVEVEHSFFYADWDKSIFDSSPPCNLLCCSGPNLTAFISY